MSTCTQVDNRLNKNIFKLLLHFCCAVDKCNQLNSPSGQTVAELTKLLCSLLIEIPDNNNFVKCLFTIVRFLISQNLYEDAGEICCYLQPGRLYNPQNSTLDLLTKVLSLWHASVSNNIYCALTSSTLLRNSETYINLETVIKQEMKMILMTYENYTKHLIVNISAHMDRIANIDVETYLIEDLYKLFFKYLIETKLYLDKDEKYVIYCHVLRIMCMFYKTIDKNNNSEMLAELSDCVKRILAEDEECHKCFEQFQNLYTTLAVPIKNYSDVAKKIKDVILHNSNIAQKYGNTGGLRCNALVLVDIVEPVLIHWEECLEADKHMVNQLVDSGLLLEMMNLFVHMSADEFYNKQESIKCKWCISKVCTVKRDLYNFIIVKCKLVSLVYKFCSKVWTQEVFVLARKILEHNIKLIINEMRECNCTRWTQLWNTCRALIFNMGLVSDYEENVRLFSLLSICFFQVRTIKPKEDLEDSISYVLNKLSVIYLNNDMHRKAMTVAAVYALLSYDKPNTKAFFIWAVIKKRAPEEIAKLTMLECLRKDKDDIESEIGFSDDISKYDLIELCSREATSLIEENVPFTSGVSRTLDELEKLKPSNYQYARVLHLLGHYLLTFQYDSSILKYYNQAISNLKLNKIGCLCLEANLRFFIFVDELDTINKQTHKEMENTKFALQARKMSELSETKSPNVVPAYTMINVKRDSSLMLKLKECVKKWNQLFECDIVSKLRTTFVCYYYECYYIYYKCYNTL